jgi:hypothetical protein
MSVCLYIRFEFGFQKECFFFREEGAKMAPLKLKSLVGYSSEDPLYPASNLVSG